MFITSTYNFLFRFWWVTVLLWVWDLLSPSPLWNETTGVPSGLHTYPLLWPHSAPHMSQWGELSTLYRTDGEMVHGKTRGVYYCIALILEHSRALLPVSDCDCNFIAFQYHCLLLNNGIHQMKQSWMQTQSLAVNGPVYRLFWWNFLMLHIYWPSSNEIPSWNDSITKLGSDLHLNMWTHLFFFGIDDLIGSLVRKTTLDGPETDVFPK